MTKAWLPMVASTVLNDNGRLRKGNIIKLGVSELRRVRSICLLRRKGGCYVDKYDYGIF